MHRFIRKENKCGHGIIALDVLMENFRILDGTQADTLAIDFIILYSLTV